MKPTQRLIALDVFRGFAIAGMILVNTPGSWSHVYPPLLHAKWAGLTFADIVFPFFLFAVGVAMYFSLRKKGLKPDAPTLKKIGKRTAILFFIGLLLNAFPFYGLNIFELRIPGVLQRIALAYGIAAVIVLYIKQLKQLAILSVATLIAYWLLLYFSVANGPFELETNLVRKIDLAIFGTGHVWDGFGIPFDPEGLLSTVPAVISVIIGFITGASLPEKLETKHIIQYAGIGIALIILSLIWNLHFPIIKAIWTSTFVLLTSGIALVTLSIFLWLIDLRKQQKWAFPLIVFGMNSLFAYVLSSVWATLLWTIQISTGEGDKISAYTWIYEHWMVPIAGQLNGSLLFAILHIILFYLVLLWLYRKRIFIRI